MPSVPPAHRRAPTSETDRSADLFDVLPALTMPPPPSSRRALNVLVAIVGLVLTAPVMLLIAVAIRLTSEGPIIYRQVRIGLDRRGTGRSGTEDTPPDILRKRKRDLGGRPFVIYKFRTMTVAKRKTQAWCTPDDPRVTPIGRFLRHHRLDELPQLWNVLRGDMNVVGPRPEQPKIFTELAAQIEDYRARQSVLPGITGMAQVELPYDQSVDDVRLKVSRDLAYIRAESFWTDLKIMVSTIPVMIFRRAAAKRAMVPVPVRRPSQRMGPVGRPW